MITNRPGQNSKRKVANLPTQKTTSESNKPDIIYNSLSTYLLPIVINNKPVTMKIDSGCHDSIINALIWQELGRPQLETATTKRYSATGVEVVLMGHFTARVRYAGRLFLLPLTVSNRTDTRNLMGRRWFPILHLDWNRIFHCIPTAHFMKKQTENERQLALETTKRTCPFYVHVKVEGVNLRMLLDTGATQSKITVSQWQLIGKPRLQPTSIIIHDTANNVMPLVGRCIINAEYNGQRGLLPLLVSGGANGYAVIGTDWFKTIRFDFNNIFETMTFQQAPKSSAGQTFEPQNCQMLSSPCAQYPPESDQSPNADAETKGRIEMEKKLPYGKTHVAIASTHRFNCPATMAIETLEATSKYKKPKSVSIAPTLPYVIRAVLIVDYRNTPHEKDQRECYDKK
ncbi:hypothetical protein OUZ56_014093 [Daphnia magna]|uniref:Peptidase A2 domain-containing protein n=1 Tax=Daphnia magna TaxID=35525 RepID=A0ABQ9Z7V6_9CRUS|nr:hypothetical protein OUZ56_014093 [Daphnia magna]